MLKRCVIMLLAWTVLTSSAYAEMATILLPDNWIGGTPGSTVEVPIRINSSQQITSILITLDYDSSRISFLSATQGSATSNWSLFTNDNPNYAPTSPGTDKNLRLLVFGGRNEVVYCNRSGRFRSRAGHFHNRPHRNRALARCG